MKISSGLRHDGHLFILFVAACWLAQKATLFHSGHCGWLTAWSTSGARGHVLAGVVTLQAFVGIGAAGTDFFVPFSGARATTHFIEKHPLGRGPLAGHVDSAVSAVAGELSQPLFFPTAGRWGRFVVWNQDRLTHKEKDEAGYEWAIDSVADAIRGHAPHFLMVLDKAFEASAPRGAFAL